MDTNVKGCYDSVVKQLNGIDRISFRAKMLEWGTKEDLEVESALGLDEYVQDLKMEVGLKLLRKWSADNGHLTLEMYEKKSVNEDVHVICELTLHTGENGMTVGEASIHGDSDEAVEVIRDGIAALNTE